MRTVIFDLLYSQPIGNTKFHGGGEYIKAVFKEFIARVQIFDNIKVIVCYDFNKFIDEWLLSLLKKEKIQTVDTKNLQDIVDFLDNIEDKHNTVFFAGIAYGYSNINLPYEITKIGTFHGLRSVEKPFDKYVLKYYEGKLLVKEITRKILLPYFKIKYYNNFKKAIKNFDIIITDSMHSKYSLMINYSNQLDNKKLYVFYPATLNALKDSKNCKIDDNNYILIISANRWIKNSYRAIKSLDELYTKGLLNNTKTKVFGNAPKQIRDLVKNKSMFEFYDYVSSTELELAYQNCSILFYPTLNEGFGNVPMEAMKYGKTCLISAVCSLPEVYQNSCYYCNPYDLKEMQGRILMALGNRIDNDFISSRLEFLNDKIQSDIDKLINLIVNTDIER